MSTSGIAFPMQMPADRLRAHKSEAIRFWHSASGRAQEAKDRRYFTARVQATPGSNMRCPIYGTVGPTLGGSVETRLFSRSIV